MLPLDLNGDDFDKGRRNPNTNHIPKSTACILYQLQHNIFYIVYHQKIDKESRRREKDFSGERDEEECICRLP